LIVIYIPVGLSATEAVIAAVRAGVARARAAGADDKPVLVCLMAEQSAGTRSDPAVEKIPSYTFPEAAGRVLSKIAAYAEWRTQPPGFIPDFDNLDLPAARAVCRKALAQHGAGWLYAEETRAVLTAVRLPLPPGGVAATAEAAVELARRSGFPVAVKLASRQVIRKTEAGGVRLNLTDAEAVRHAFAEIRDRLAQANQIGAMEGVVVQPMIAGGVEVMAG
jgi:acyl-CoA synthetase (NDP forming)